MTFQLVLNCSSSFSLVLPESLLCGPVARFISLLLVIPAQAHARQGILYSFNLRRGQGRRQLLCTNLSLYLYYTIQLRWGFQPYFPP